VRFVRFSCLACGRCCKGTPGYVFFDEWEGKRMAEFLGLDFVAFLRKYARRLEDGRWSLREFVRGDYRCVFLKDDRCLIYPVRPLQCREYPFWDSILVSPDKWYREMRRCPGIGQGREWSMDEIREFKEMLRHERGKQDS